ncbi:MAG: copper homeostasis protein CutC [Phycisphaerales bacterium]
MTLEIAVDSVADAVAAARFADRIELARDLASHGFTPTPRVVADVRAAMRTPLVVLVRPESQAGPSFLADTATLALMERQIGESLDAGADAIAVGVLDDRAEIDVPACARLVKACADRPVVFHRAFDLAADTDAALNAITDLGFSRVLTAGCPSLDHGAFPLRARLDRMAATAERARARIGVVACGGVRSHNIGAFVRAAGEVHSSCRTTGEPHRFDADEAEAVRLAIDAARSSP